MASRNTSDIVRIQPSADLDAWSGRDWSNGVQIDELAPLERLIVETRNSQYDITIVDPRGGEIIVQGGRFFPTPTRACLSGASLGGSFLKLLGIYIGFGMEIRHEDDTVITSPVQSIAARPDGAAH